MEAGLMFGNSKQQSITLASGGGRPAMMTDQRRVQRQECLFEWATAFSGSARHDRTIEYSKALVTLI
jgi:hypothetical protein